MDLTFLFFKSMLIGLSVAMPIGPISILAIKNCLTRGFKIGFATSFGASITEGFYAFVATGGLIFISKFLTNYSSEVRLISGCALILLAAYEISTAHKFSLKKEIKVKQFGFFKTMFFVSFLTLGSPVTVTLFIGIFATMSGTVLSQSEIIITIVGIFLGSVLWAFILCGTVTKLRHKLSEKWVARVKIFSGTIIGGFGVYGISSVLL